MAVHGLALHRDEQVAGADFAAIEGDAIGGEITVQRAAGCSSDGRIRSKARSCRALPRDLHIVEGQHLVADDLALFVALAGDQHDIIGAARGNCRGNRAATVGNFAWRRVPPP